MASERTCTHCHRQEPDAAFISSSGFWCIECLARLQANEREKRLWRANPFYFTSELSELGEKSLPNRPTRGRGKAG